jgi:polyphosphate glucokinase
MQRRRENSMQSERYSKDRCVLVIDVGGSHVKVMHSEDETERKVKSGPDMTAEQMVSAVQELTAGWNYDVISMGYPGPVLHGRIVQDPINLGPGWVGFDFSAAFQRPIKILNDAAMQALGSYEGGSMLFLGLGTGLGTALVVDGSVQPMEMGHLPYRDGKTFEDLVGAQALSRLGEERWRSEVREVVAELVRALEPDYVVLGGGNAKRLDELPPNCRRGDNDNAFRGGFEMWAEA